MSDIHDCIVCKEKVYMDNAEQCVVCDSWFCGACDYKNGEKLWDDENKCYYYVCSHCLEHGLEYINDDNEDDAVFAEEEYNRAIKELNERQR